MGGAVDPFNCALGKNISTFIHPKYFTVCGFSGVPNAKYYYVFLFFVYIVSVMGNCIVMAVIYLDPNLKTPKYIAVFSLALSDLCGMSTLVPKVIDIFLFEKQHIPYDSGWTYYFFFSIFLCMQSLNLVVLSYDRLVAITFPLHYHMIVNHRSMYAIVASFWLFSIALMLTATALHSGLSFCKPLVLNSFFIDIAPVMQKACMDNYTYINYVFGNFIPVLILWLPLLFILATYCCIGYALSKIATAQERFKAMKTCTSHLLLVAVNYLPYIITMSLNQHIHHNARMINLSLNSTLPSMLNPIIYVLQTEEVKESVKKLLRFKRQSKITLKT